MREAPDRAYYAVPHADGRPTACHAKRAWAEARGLVEITAEEALALRRMREVPARNVPRGPVTSEHAADIYARLDEHERRVAAMLRDHPPIAPSTGGGVMDTTTLEAVAQLAEQQNVDRLANTVRFEALSAKTDPAPTERKYPALALALGLTASATADDWAHAIASFEASGD
jgi:hypothetical protein